MARTGFIKFILVGLLIVSAVADVVAMPSPAVGARKGYLDSVREEPREVLHEVLLVPDEKFEEPSLTQRIFDAKLTKELTQKYESDFGYTEIQRIAQSPSRYADVRYGNGLQVTAEEDLQRRQRYGEYMTRKITEYHLDKYMKTEPAMRQVYEAKQALQNMNVTVKKGYKLNGNYSLTENSLTLKLDNPYALTNRLTLEFNNETFGNETIIFASMPITKKMTLSGDVRLQQGSWSLSAGRQLSRTWAGNVSALYTRIDPNLPQMENRYLLGVSWAN